MSDLRDQLARFHEVVTGRASLESARELVERGDIDQLDRMRAYEYAYTARIASVLVQDYPKLARHVGEPVFRAWAPEYLRAHPPSDFSLREVGAQLAAWLAPRDEADLARIERARIEVFDGPDALPLSRDDLAAMDPAEFPSLELRLVPSSRVVAITSNADDLWDALEDDRDGTLAHGPSRIILVWRRDFKVLHRTLEPDEARIVPTMIDGTTFGAACELLDEDSAAERAIELLVRWLDAAVLFARRG